jgi:hypothetical protein
MKKLFNALNLPIAVLFIAALVYFIFLLNTLPAEAYAQLKDNDLVMPLYIALGAGLLSLIFNQVIIGNLYMKEVIYVDRIKREEKTAAVEIEEDHSLAILKSFLTELENIKEAQLTPLVKAEKILFSLCNKIQAGQGIMYKKITEAEKEVIKPYVTYAYAHDKEEDMKFEMGEGLAGLAAKENKYLCIDNLPEGYINIMSGLGKNPPAYLVILPLVAMEKVTGVLELALFWKPENEHHAFFKELSSKIGPLLTEENTSSKLI